jgi:hypothetical protein
MALKQGDTFISLRRDNQSLICSKRVQDDVETEEMP